MMPADYHANDPLATERDFNGDPIDDRAERVPSEPTASMGAIVGAILLAAVVIAIILWLV
jgi:hypothetical protein